MPRDYRRILRARGEPDPLRGRPPEPSAACRIRELWGRLTGREKAEFMAWAGWYGPDDVEQARPGAAEAEDDSLTQPRRTSP